MISYVFCHHYNSRRLSVLLPDGAGAMRLDQEVDRIWYGLKNIAEILDAIT